MKRIDTRESIRPTIQANNYLKSLKEKGVFERTIDAYLFAAAYAIKHNLEIASIPSRDRQTHVMMNIVNEDVRLALEAGIHAIRKRNQQLEPENSREVLEIITQYAEAGVESLRQRWEGKTAIQIQYDISKIINLCS
jgi:hypothetical protein